MVAFYKLEFTYPDGHVEEIEETFIGVTQARVYGDSLLVQVANTEQYRSSRGKTLRQPYYCVIENANGERKIVFDSRRP